MPMLTLLAGLLPFLLCGLAALTFQDNSARVFLLALIAYGTVVLAFLGGIHWAGAYQTGASRLRGRAAVGLMAAGFGWAAMVLTVALSTGFGLVALVVGYAGLAVGEARLAREGRLPEGGMWLRWLFAGVVIVMLGAVLLLQLLGGRVVF